jgi:hypothetical protein
MAWPVAGHGDGGEPAGPAGGAVLQFQLPRPVQEHVDERPLGGGQEHLGDELLAFDPAAVATDELHPRAGQSHAEHPGFGGVGQPQPHTSPARAVSEQSGARSRWFHERARLARDAEMALVSE